MAAPVLRVYFAWGETWKSDETALDLAWDDESVYARHVEGVSVSRGRSSELDEDRAGTVSLTLNNADRRFDPQYASSPHVGNLLPGVPVKITGQPSGQSEVPIFVGYVEGWPQDYALGDTLSTVNLQAVDAFGKLATAGLASSVYAVSVLGDEPKGWWRLSETAGDSMADTSGNGYHGDFTRYTTAKTTRSPNPFETIDAIEFDGSHRGIVTDDLARIDDVPFLIEALVFLDKVETEFEVTTQQDIYRQGDGTQEGQHITLGVTSDGNLFGRSSMPSASFATRITSTDLRDGNPHHVAYRRTTLVHQLYIDGELMSTSAGASSTTQATDFLTVGGSSLVTPFGQVGVRGVAADVAAYDQSLVTEITDHYEAFSAPLDGQTTGERIDWKLDSIGFPSDLRDIATGVAILGPAVLGQNALPSIKKDEAAEQGRLFIGKDGHVVFRERYYHQTVTQGSTSQATFSDDGSDIPYASLGFDYDARMIFNRVRGSSSDGGEVEVYDQTSIDAYGERVDSSLSGMDLPTVGVQSLIELRLDRYKNPALRARPITVHLHGCTAAQQATILGLELGYRVNLERTPQGVGSAIDQDTIIEGISHSIGEGVWDVTFTLSPVDTKVYGLWGSGLWDTALWAA